MAVVEGERGDARGGMCGEAWRVCDGGGRDDKVGLVGGRGDDEVRVRAREELITKWLDLHEREKVDMSVEGSECSRNIVM